MMNDKDTPVSLAAFKAYSELSKKKFRSQSAVRGTSDGNYIKITVKSDLESGKIYAFYIQGLTSDQEGGSIWDFINFSTTNEDRWAGAALSYGSKTLSSGAVVVPADSGSFDLYLDYDTENIKAVSVDALAFAGGSEDSFCALNRVQEISFVTDWPQEVGVNIGFDDDDQIPIHTLAQSTVPVFTITNAESQVKEYPTDHAFNSIQYAGALYNPISISLSGAVSSDPVETQLDGDVTIQTEIASDIINDLKSDVITDVIEQIASYPPAVATDQALGSIKLFSSEDAGLLSNQHRVQLNGEGRAYVQVDSSLTAGNGIAITNGEVSVIGYTEDDESLTFEKNLQISGDSEFEGDVLFTDTAEFQEDTTFEGKVTLSDSISQIQPTQYSANILEPGESSGGTSLTATVTLGEYKKTIIPIPSDNTLSNLSLSIAGGNGENDTSAKESVMVTNSSSTDIEISPTYSGADCTWCTSSTLTTIPVNAGDTAKINIERFTINDAHTYLVDYTIFTHR